MSQFRTRNLKFGQEFVSSKSKKIVVYCTSCRNHVSTIYLFWINSSVIDYVFNNTGKELTTVLPLKEVFTNHLLLYLEEVMATTFKHIFALIHRNTFPFLIKFSGPLIPLTRSFQWLHFRSWSETGNGAGRWRCFKSHYAVFGLYFHSLIEQNGPSRVWVTGQGSAFFGAVHLSTPLPLFLQRHHLIKTNWRSLSSIRDTWRE